MTQIKRYYTFEWRAGDHSGRRTILASTKAGAKAALLRDIRAKTASKPWFRLFTTETVRVEI